MRILKCYHFSLNTSTPLRHLEHYLNDHFYLFRDMRNNSTNRNSNTLATGCEELTHWKRPWCWEKLNAGGEGDDRGWDGWMSSLTQWTWVWVNFGSWWWTARPGMLQSMGSQRVGHDWVTGLNWWEIIVSFLSMRELFFFSPSK